MGYIKTMDFRWKICTNYIGPDPMIWIGNKYKRKPVILQQKYLYDDGTEKWFDVEIMR